MGTKFCANGELSASTRSDRRRPHREDTVSAVHGVLVRLMAWSTNLALIGTLGREIFVYLLFLLIGVPLALYLMFGHH